MKLKQQINKWVFRVMFAIMFLYVLIVLGTNNIYSYKDLMNYNHIICNKVETSFHSWEVCENLFYNSFCEGERCPSQYVKIGSCLDFEGNFIQCPPKPNIFYQTSFKMLFYFIVTSFLINDFINKRCKKNGKSI